MGVSFQKRSGTAKGVREAGREGCRGAPRALPMQLTSMAFSQELCRQPNAPLSAMSELLTFRFLKRDPHAPPQRMPFIPALLNTVP